MAAAPSRALPASLRRTNERTLIGFLMRLSGVARAQLAKAAGISQPKRGKIVDELLEPGVVVEVEEAGAGAGPDFSLRPEWRADRGPGCPRPLNVAQ